MQKFRSDLTFSPTISTICSNKGKNLIYEYLHLSETNVYDWIINQKERLLEGFLEENEHRSFRVLLLYLVVLSWSNNREDLNVKLTKASNKHKGEWLLFQAFECLAKDEISKAKFLLYHAMSKFAFDLTDNSGFQVVRQVLNCVKNVELDKCSAFQDFKQYEYLKNINPFRLKLVVLHNHLQNQITKILENSETVVSSEHELTITVFCDDLNESLKKLIEAYLQNSHQLQKCLLSICSLSKEINEDSFILFLNEKSFDFNNDSDLAFILFENLENIFLEIYKSDLIIVFENCKFKDKIIEISIALSKKIITTNIYNYKFYDQITHFDDISNFFSNKIEKYVNFLPYFTNSIDLDSQKIINTSFFKNSVVCLYDSFFKEMT